MVRGQPLKKAGHDNKDIGGSPGEPEDIKIVPKAIQKTRLCPKGGPGEDEIPKELDRWIRQRGRNLRLRPDERQAAVKLVNNLKNDLKKFLKDNEEQPFFKDVSVFTSGSYYEFVKINKPDEFDIMLKLKTPRIQWTMLEKFNGLFYTISLKRPPRGAIRAFLLEDGLTISASKVMKEMHRLVQKFIKTYKVSKGRWVVCRKKINSPAVTLEFQGENEEEEILSVDIVPALEVSQGWPEPARAGPDVDNWLGKNDRRKILGKPFYFVPKRPKTRNLSDVEKESWRISFSHIEKEIIRYHGNKRTCCEGKQNECCRKLCLRLLKCLFEGLKQRYPNELDALCSYHGKTAFFYNLSERFEDSLWTPGQLPVCFMKLLCRFESAVNDGCLPHFFVPVHNLFSSSSFPKRSLLFLGNALREQRESGLPLLRVPDPVPRLCYSPVFQVQAQENGQPLKKAGHDNKDTVGSPVEPEDIKIVPSPKAIQKISLCPKGGPGLDEIPKELDCLIRQRGQDLRRDGRQVAVELVNDLRNDLVKFLKDNEEQPFFRDVSVLNSGSYYEFVKINKPDEFDLMLKLKTRRIQWTMLEKFNGLFYTISLKRPPRGAIRAFLLEDGLTISASKVMKEMHRLVQKFIKTYKVSKGRWVVCRKKINSPAVTLEFQGENDGKKILSVDIVPALEVSQGWPAPARAGPDVDNWLGKNGRRKFLGQPFYFVPKRPKTRNLSDVEKESWRISFSHIEKEIIRYHGNKRTCCEGKQNKCCRKLCLRLLKCLFEGLKQRYPNELDALCSYHGKTAFFYNLSERFEDSLWTPGQLSVCFMKLLCRFESAVNDGHLPHFFVPDHNLFSSSSFPKRSLLFLGNALREQRESGLPLLRVPDPVPRLCYSPALQVQAQENALEPQNCDNVKTGRRFFSPVVLTSAFIFCAIIYALYLL